jgi:hypothetical protein
VSSRKFVARVNFEEDGHVTAPGEEITLPYGSERDRERVDNLLLTRVLEPAEHAEAKKAPRRKR